MGSNRSLRPVEERAKPGRKHVAQNRADKSDYRGMRARRTAMLLPRRQERR
jgi:hypothetical protein